MTLKLKRAFRYNITGRYFNANGFAVAIVASITHNVDWAAYIGGALGSLSKGEAVRFVLKYGRKLAEKDGRYFFPELKDTPYRH